MSAKFELNVWSGDWGLPSIDHKCLQMMAFCRFSGVPIKTNEVNNPLWTRLPSFVHKKTSLSDLKEVVNYLKDQNYSADFNLSAKDMSDVLAYDSLLRSQLEPALLYLLWADDHNYVELTRGWYAKRLPFPTNYFIPNLYKSSAEKTIRSRFGPQILNNDQSNSLIETTVIGEAQKCLTLLSERLKDEYFFGKNPSSFDAIVFGYLAPILKVPTHNRVLQNHLKSCDNLTKFVNKILKNYFPTVKDNESKSSCEANSPQESDESDEFIHKWRDMFVSGLFATTAMTAYALVTGLVRIDVLDDEPEDESNQEFSAIFDDYPQDSDQSEQ